MVRRRFSENSVMVSIDEVRDLLKEELPAEARTRVERRLPKESPSREQNSIFVPSAAEISAGRKERWTAEGTHIAPIKLKRSWKGILRLLFLPLVLSLGALGGAFAAQHFNPSSTTPLMLAFQSTQQQAQQLNLRLRLQAMLESAEERRAQLSSLLSDRRRQEAELQELKEELEQANLKLSREEKQPKSKGKARSKRHRSKRSGKRRSRQRRARKPRKPRKPLNRTDKNLDDLMDSL